jgi:rubrerythrin
VAESKIDFNEALSGAIYKEIGARDFYGRIAKRISNPEGRIKFEQLSADEEGHREKLASWFLELVGEEFIPSEEGIKGSEIKEFPIEESTGALKALDIAAEAEAEANKFYTEQAGRAAEAGNEKLKNLFLELAAEEQGHYNLLTAERNSLIGGFYWFDMDSTSFMED